MAEADPLRLYAIVSDEALTLMKGVRGKFGAQTGHAFMHAFWNAEEMFPEVAKAYRTAGRAYKIVLLTATTAELKALFDLHAGVCGRTLVEDAGLTVFNGPTVTAVGLGPIRRSDLRGGAAELVSLT